MLYKRLRNYVTREFFGPRPELQSERSIQRLGSTYGGWHFLPEETLRGSTIISCGLGEDASFDVEFASTFGARVIIVDPTPRAVRHYEQIIGRIGEPRARPYVSGGRQPVDAYDLSAIGGEQLVLVPKALWTEEATLPFYLPADPEHVSHSLIDHRNSDASSGRKIDVETTTLAELMDQYGITQLPLLKLDIEGAEVPVIEQLLAFRIRPGQMLIEFDELTQPSRQATQRWRQTDHLLRQAGYSLPFWDRRSNFLYSSI